jgi:sugar O-acyltransferase (sialic acid O-acetyltransferase NeuD family)
MKQKIIIIGAGQMGELVSNIILRQNKYSILGFIDNKKIKKKINGYKIIGDDLFLQKNKNICKNVVIAVADIKLRFKIFKRLYNLNFDFPNVIDPSAIIDKNVSLKKGIIICMNSVILNRTKIDTLSIIGTSVNILHDVKIGKNCVIGGGSVIGANIECKDNVFIGVGSVFPSKRIIIGNNSFVSSGAVVLKSIKNNSKVIGNPARFIGVND